MNISLNNLNKPSNKRLKRIADIALYVLPLIIGTVISMPVSDLAQKWIIFGLNIVVIGFKAFTKFTTNEISIDPTTGDRFIEQ